MRNAIDGDTQRAVRSKALPIVGKLGHRQIAGLFLSQLNQGIQVTSLIDGEHASRGFRPPVGTDAGLRRSLETLAVAQKGNAAGGRHNNLPVTKSECRLSN